MMTSETAPFEWDKTTDEVTVRPAGGGPMLPLPVPPGFTPAAFRNALAAAYSAYLSYGKIPTTAQVHEMWDRIPEETYAALFVTEEFISAMSNRGVRWDATKGLEYEQAMAIDLLSNPLDKRSAQAKLKELGVSYVKYQAWLKNPLFMRIMQERSEHNLHEHLPTVLNALVGRAEAGNMVAIDRVLAITGRFDPNNREQVLIRDFMQAFLRIIAVDIPDEKMRNQIADHMLAAAGNIAMIESTTQGV